MDEDILALKRNFTKIKNMGYVKSIRKGDTGVSATLEHLLKSIQDDSKKSNYKMLEIKTKRSYSKARIVLFNAIPTGSSKSELKRLIDTYGCESPRDSNLKYIKVEVSTKELKEVNINYYFNLSIDKSSNKLYLKIYNKQKILIDDSTYWHFSVLKEKLIQKLSVLAIIKAWPKFINEEEYFKYYKINIYLLNSFDDFIKLIEDGIIKISFRISCFYDTKRYIKINSHSICFSILEGDLLGMYNLYR